MIHLRLNRSSGDPARFLHGITARALAKLLLDDASALTSVPCKAMMYGSCLYRVSSGCTLSGLLITRSIDVIVRGRKPPEMSGGNNSFSSRLICRETVHK